MAVAAATAPVPGAPPAGAATRYPDPVFSGVTVTKDVVYGAARDFDGRIQQLDLDLYQPTGDTLAKRPVIVLAFGGGFWFGTKEQLAKQATAYAKRGFVAASITYRLDEDAGPLRNPFDASGRARIGAAANFLSRCSPTPAAARVYVDPAELLELGLLLTPAVRLDHTYLPNDFTLHLYKTPAWEAAR